ncbi:UDP-N-acetylmuramoyl-tripeptide--D-alanyl-D-alanine ligase [Coraliomargarita parva]|uniref:UDP-N-acetylmuramoyl-tripeptide--D-alanyl-D- alanine ligase n=1 Tax=Coraliomargarita parva TaxID=3014050 RepID=UPI0022B3B739|nr:UDP-N-acetylmuramoyl-tripeptide--D-alanyl-D-alanine ligase [Coraliomargarita parva]
MLYDPQAIEQWSGGQWQGEAPERITGFAFDARQLKPGECFFALSGGLRDGHEFVAQALLKGASAVVVERILPLDIPQLVVTDSLRAMGKIAAGIRSRFSKPVIGVTGSAGKTSTKEMLYAVLGPERTHATAGNWNNRIGVPMTLFGLDARKEDYAVIEAGINQPGEMALLGQMIAADLCIVTMIGAAHLELLGSLEGVAREKALLADFAVSDSPIILPNAALQYPSFRKLARRAIVLARQGEVIFGNPRVVVHYERSDAGPGRSCLRLEGEEFPECFELASRSHGICSNAALVILAARELGLDLGQVRERLSVWRPAPARGCVAESEGRWYYIDCYNANPSSMVDAMAAFAASVDESTPRCYVLGAMNELGESSVEWHRSTTAQLAPRAGDCLYLVGPKRLTTAYRDGALEAGWSAGSLREAENAENLKSFVAEREGAIFLKGSRSYALEMLLPETLR